MTDNMKYWNAMARPPKGALKQIVGGRLKGMSNISPQWRWQVMTEQFGMIGFGWKYTVEKIWTSPASKEEHFAFASINLYVKVDDVWSEAIPGEGGAMLIANERSGMHNSDEAFKMAVTDALGTAMAKLGVAADIYLGAFDGSKYTRPANDSTQAKAEVTPDAGMKPVDEEFNGGAVEAAKEVGGVEKLSKADLRKAENLKPIADATKKNNKEVVLAIGKMNGEEFTIQEVIEFIKGEKA